MSHIKIVTQNRYLTSVVYLITIKRYGSKCHLFKLTHEKDVYKYKEI